MAIIDDYNTAKTDLKKVEFVPRAGHKPSIEKFFGGNLFSRLNFYDIIKHEVRLIG